MAKILGGQLGLKIKCCLNVKRSTRLKRAAMPEPETKREKIYDYIFIFT